MPNLLLMRGAFVIRLRQETNPADGHFEGSIEEVDSGKQLKFQSSTELLRFLGERFQAAFEDTPENDRRSPPKPRNNRPEPIAVQVPPVMSRFRTRPSWNGDIMKLQIIWRNPQPPRTKKVLVRQVVADAYGALYEVRSTDEVKLFEVLEYRAA
jgi:hypothetical protein